MGKTLIMNEEELEKAIASAKKSLDRTRSINYAPPNEETMSEWIRNAVRKAAKC